MSAASSFQRIGQCDIDPLGGISMAGLAALSDPKHEAVQPIEIICHGRRDPKTPPGSGVRIPCPTQEKITIPLFFQTVTACDACRREYEKAEKLDAATAYWNEICPDLYQQTVKSHPDFPKVQYEATKGYCGEESIFLYGPARLGKTRLAMVLLRRCLVRYGLRVNVIWPEQLEATKKSFDTLEQIKKWGRYDVLLMDDALLTGAQDDRITSFLKNLIDYRMRYKRHQIITSQVGSADYEAQGDKFHNITPADKKRIGALLGRIKEISRVIMFGDTKPGSGQADF